MWRYLRLQQRMVEMKKISWKEVKKVVRDHEVVKECEKLEPEFQK